MDQQRRATEVELIGGPADGRFIAASEFEDLALEVPTVRGFAIYRRVPETGRFVYATWRPK